MAQYAEVMFLTSLLDINSYTNSKLLVQNKVAETET